MTLELGLGGSQATALDTGVADASAAVRVEVAGGAAGRLVAETSEATAVVTAHASAPWQAGEERLTARVSVPAGGRRTVRLGVAVTGHAGAGPAAPGARAWDAHQDEDAAQVSWEDLRARQAGTHGRLVAASVLDLRASRDDPTTEELWAAARDGDPQARRRVVEVAYLSGRANAVAATGELPPTLQGVWQGTWRPAWSADYTLNGNVQNGGVAGLIPTGTPELAGSLLTLVLEHLDDYRDNARLVFGAEGMLLPSRMSTHGRADHVSAEYPHVFWTGCGGWVLRFTARSSSPRPATGRSWTTGCGRWSRGCCGSPRRRP